jgi:hypothetical protein
MARQLIKIIICNVEENSLSFDQEYSVRYGKERQMQCLPLLNFAINQTNSAHNMILCLLKVGKAVAQMVEALC